MNSGTICVYCGSSGELTADHVPPKNIFPKPRPALVTVPACKKCNSKASLDDEYFRLMLVMRDDVYDSSETKKLWTTALRGLKRKERGGLKKVLLKTIKHRPTYTSGGIYVGKRSTYHINLNRIYNVVERTVQGLYYHHKGYPIPKPCEISTIMLEAMNQAKFNDPDVRQIISAVSKQDKNEIGKDIFSYKYLETSDRKDSVVWLLTFFNRVYFLVSTIEDSKESV